MLRSVLHAGRGGGARWISALVCTDRLGNAELRYSTRADGSPSLPVAKRVTAMRLPVAHQPFIRPGNGSSLKVRCLSPPSSAAVLTKKTGQNGS